MGTLKNNLTAIIPFSEDTHLSVKVKQFLTVLNSGDGPPIESMSPWAARDVLYNGRDICSPGHSSVTLLLIIHN